jgi:hypothetical protein
MASDDAEDPAPGPSHVPALINDYRAHRDAWRAQARGLARMREDVLAAAEREAREIVTAARVDVRQILVKARRDLLVLAAQVEAATGTSTSQESAQSDYAGDADYAIPVQLDDLGPARDVVASARHDVRSVLNDARPDLEALSSEAGALRSSLQWHPRALNKAPSRVVIPPPPAPEQPATPLPVVSALRPIVVPRSMSAFVLAFVVVGVTILMATGWWLRRSTGDDDVSPQQTVEPVARPPASQPTGALDALPRPGRIEKPTALSVTIEARRLAWIRATVDGRVVSARLFEAGETRQIMDARDVLIRAGDAGAVFVSVNGGKASALGRDGQVVTRRFVFEDADESVGSSSLPSPGNTGVVPNEGTSQEAPTPRPAPASEGPDIRPQGGGLDVNAAAAPDTRPQAGGLDVNAAAAPLATDTALPRMAPEAPAGRAAAGSSLQEEFVRAAEQWLAAYYRQDRNAMAVFSEAQLSIADERSAKERLPPGLAGARQSLEDVNFQVFGDGAVLSAKLTERWENTGAAQMAMSESFVSQIWTRRAGTWRLTDVRIVSASTLNRTFR